ncbi:MAG: hypothetical protein AB3N16_09870 [Flavobacteriaceae bacterium]
MGKMAISVLALFLIGCSSSVSKGDLHHLNGYWTIKEVSFSEGTAKQYKGSTSIDFIQWDGKKGFKKKVVPKWDGTFTASDDALFFTITEVGGTFFLNFSKGDTTWQETIVSLSHESLVQKNQEGISYIYTRFEPIETQKK